MRGGDRLEAAMVLLIAMLMLVLIPIAAAYGTVTHTRLEDHSQLLRAAEHQVPAVLLEDAHTVSNTADDSLGFGGNRGQALARWSAAGGENTGVVSVDPGAEVGQTISVTIGSDGTVATYIRTDPENTMVAVSAAGGVWALGAGGLLLIVVGAHTHCWLGTGCGNGRATGTISTRRRDDTGRGLRSSYFRRRPAGTTRYLRRRCFPRRHRDRRTRRRRRNRADPFIALLKSPPAPKK